MFKMMKLSRQFATGLRSPKIVPYFCPTHSLEKLKSQKEHFLSKPQDVKVGGRIIGKRKASKSLLFLDIESSGS